MGKYITSLGDITDRIWGVREALNDKITFKSLERFDEKSCYFQIGQAKYNDWNIESVTYNDFGGEYKHCAKRNSKGSSHSKFYS